MCQILSLGNLWTLAEVFHEWKTSRGNRNVRVIEQFGL